MADCQGRFSVEDLVRSSIVTDDGKRIGKVVEIAVTPAPDYQISRLYFGKSAWLYRFHVLEPLVRRFGLSLRPNSVSWNDVQKFEHLTVTLKPDRQPQNVEREELLRQRHSRVASEDLDGR